MEIDCARIIIAIALKLLILRIEILDRLHLFLVSYP